MFKLLSLALISIVGMNYANNSENNIKRAVSTPTINGGTNWDEVNSGFYLPSTYESYSYEYQSSFTPYVNYSVYFRFKADYIYYKTYSSSGETMVDSRDFSYSNDITHYGMQIVLSQNGRFTWLIDTMTSEGQARRDVIAYISYNDESNKNGLQLFYENYYDHMCFYVSNFVMDTNGFQRDFYGLNSSLQTETVHTSSNRTLKSLPLTVDGRFHSLEKYYYFPVEPTVYGYWYKPQDTYFIQPPLGSIGSISRPTIFNGYFKNQGNYYAKYQFDGTNNEQPSAMNSSVYGWYFGPYNDVPSLSRAIHPSTGTQFWFANMGLFTTFKNTITPVWYTLTTPVTSSGVTVQVISDTFQWYSMFYQEIYLVYEVVDTSGNLTALSNLSYYDMLSFNTGFVSNPSINTDPFSAALTLLGVAFQRVWSIGNIVIFGSITINTLILMPILVGLVIFLIHLIKKG